LSKEDKSEDSKEPEGSDQPQENPWTPEAVESIIRLIDTLAKDYLQFRREDSDAKVKRLSSVAGHNRRLIYSLVLFLTAIIGLMAFLTALGKVSGDALLFLAGTVTGYIIIMIQDFILSPIEEPTKLEQS
jgi:hypothetical protein